MNSIIFDYSTVTPAEALPVLRDMVREGMLAGVIRYLCPVPNAKHITMSEYAQLDRYEIPVWLVWEDRSTDWLTHGGTTHGTWAAQQALDMGYARDRVIFGSADFDMTRAQWNETGLSYGRSFTTMIRSYGYPAGVYGSWDTIEWAASDIAAPLIFWQSMSPAYSDGRNDRIHPLAHLWQQTSAPLNSIPHILTVDQNTVQKSFWTPEGSLMRIAKVTGMMTPRIPTEPVPCTRWFKGDGLFYTEIIDWPEHDDEFSIPGTVEKTFDVHADWRGWVGRTNITQITNPQFAPET